MKTGIYGDRCFLAYLHAPGGRWITKDEALGGGFHRQQFFSLIQPDTVEVLHFDVTRLQELIQDREPPFDAVRLHEVEVTEADHDNVWRHHGIEVGRVARLTPVELEQPGFVADFGNRQSIIDGNHRYVARFRRGDRHMRFFWLSEAQWKLSLFDLPTKLGREFAEGRAEMSRLSVDAAAPVQREIGRPASGGAP